MSDLVNRAKQAQADQVDGAEGERFWKKLEEDATEELGLILGQDPGPAAQLEVGTKRHVAQTATYPAALQSRQLLVFYPDGVEVVAYKQGGSWKFYIVHRSNNPMEESVLSEFSDLASFGRALG